MILTSKISGRILISVILSLVFFSVTSASADENSNAKKTYKMMLRYPITIPFKYSCAEKTDVTRQMIPEKTKKSDSKDSKTDTAQFVFQRKVATHFTLLNKDLPRDGFSNYIVKLDSIDHSITTNGKTKQFSTNNGDLIKSWNEDLEQYNIPVSREFAYVVTSYDEFADIIDDSDINATRTQIDTSRNLKAADRCLWKTALSDERFYQLTDVKKIEFPSKRMEEDSTWISPIEFQVEGVTIFDTIEVKFTEERGKYLFMEAKFSPRYFVRDSLIEYGFRDVIAIPDSVKLNCVFKLELTPNNTVDSATITAEGNIGFSLIDGRKFVDAIKTETQWTRLGQYNW